VAEVAKRFHKLTIESINRRGTMHAAYDRALNTVAGTLAQAMPPQFDTHLARAISSHPDIECLYVLNPAGRQVSSTMCNPDVIPEHRRFIYQPAPKGTDHSLKEYYLPIRAGLPRFTTEPYISMASGNLHPVHGYRPARPARLRPSAGRGQAAHAEPPGHGLPVHGHGQLKISPASSLLPLPYPTKRPPA